MTGEGKAKAMGNGTGTGTLAYMEVHGDVVVTRSAWVVYIDTRDAKGNVVQLTDSVCGSPKTARRRTRHINTREDAYPNTVAWIEVEDRADPVQLQRNTQAKMTWDNVREIRQRRAHGDKVPALAAEFNVTRQTIYDIVSGRSWKEGQEAA